MIKYPPPMSNTERQRRFRERNPGYYQRLHAKRRAAVKAYGEKRRLEQKYRAVIAPPTQLCLPAPDQVSTITIDFTALLRERQAQRAAAATPTNSHA